MLVYVHMCIFLLVMAKLFFFLIIYSFIYLFLAALGLCCCARAFSSCSKWGLLFVVVHGLLIVVSSLVAEHGLYACRLQKLWHMGLVAPWHVRSSRTRARTVSPALAGGFLTMVPPGQSQSYF